MTAPTTDIARHFEDALKDAGIQVRKKGEWTELDAEESRLNRHADPVALEKGNSEITSQGTLF
jgi:hypothetical protein